MEDKLIKGKEISLKIKEELKEEIIKLKDKTSKVPGLAVILVGEDPASEVYVRNKKRSCDAVGIKSFEYKFNESVSQKELLELIDKLNLNDEVDGILVQLPIPKHIDKDLIINSISPDKDVDGFHPVNVGKLVTNTCLLVSCTPAGIIELLDRYNVDIQGKNAVIIGRSDIVGKPVSMLLLHRHATVTICHSRTKNISDVIKSADIIVAAVGRAKFVKGDMVKEGAVVIDVGINRTDEGLVGDVDFLEVSKKASLITPVPGGVGPMTIALLLKNTVKAFKNLKKVD